MIELDQLSRRFGSIVAVDDVSLTVRPGEVVGFLGPNGAGKTTTMRLATGYLPPTMGRARIDGIDVIDDPVAARRRFGYLPEGAPLYPEMTPRGLLRFAGSVRGLTRRGIRQAMDRVVDRIGLAEVLDRPIGTLSKGFKRRTALAAALLHQPPALILDEPTDGLDPNQKHEVRRLIGELAPETAIVVSTHLLEEVETVCTRAVVIAGGRIVADQTPAELADRLPGGRFDDVFRMLTSDGAANRNAA